MNKSQKMIPLKDLNLTNRFLFDEVMEDPQTHQDVLSIIFEKEIPLLIRSETEKELRVSPELVNFLHYLENTTDHVASQSESERIQRIHKRVKEVRMNEEAGVKYMQAWEERYYDKQEAREEGLAEGLANHLKKQVRKKLAKNNTIEEIADALEEDISVIQKTLEELNIDDSES